jgi:hypothetical protein
MEKEKVREYFTVAMEKEKVQEHARRRIARERMRLQPTDVTWRG